MTTNPKSLPEGASVVIPRLVCRDAAAEIDFWVSTFGAAERLRRPGPRMGPSRTQ
jgi:PhnB protein